MKNQSSITRKKKSTVNSLLRDSKPHRLALLCLLICSSSAFQFSNFTPVYRPKLETLPLGQALLSDVREFLSTPERDATLLENILQSGTINGFFDHKQVFGVFEVLFEEYPSHVKGFHSIGQTFQGNEIMALRLGQRQLKPHKPISNSVYSEHFGDQKHSDPVALRSLILMTGAHHSRELLTQNMIVKVALEHLHKLVHAHEKGASFGQMTDLLLVPFVNLDGHKFISDVFDFETGQSPRIQNPFFAETSKSVPKFSDAKYKRKNMNTGYCLDDASGVDVGVDLNRNYGYHWTHYEKDDENECSEVYKGPFPFSEPETNSMRRLIEREKNFLVLILNFHTYGNLWVRPFNFSRHARLGHFGIDQHLLSFYNQMETEIKQLTPAAQVGNAIKMVDYKAMGEASDWALGEHKIVAYSPELGYSDARFDNFFIAREIINKALNENFRVIDRMISKSLYTARDFEFYLSNRQEFVLALDNQTLGKVFNGKFVVQASDKAFFGAVEEVWLEQEGFEREKLVFRMVNLDGESPDEPVQNEEGQPRVIQGINDNYFMQIDFSELNYLSKMRLIFGLKRKGPELTKVTFELGIVVNDIFEIQKFEFSQVFSYSKFWKYCFLFIMYLNLVGVLILILFKCIFPIDFFMKNPFDFRRNINENNNLSASAEVKNK